MTAILATIFVCASVPRSGALIPNSPALPVRYEDEAEPFNRHTRRRAAKLKRKT